MIDGTTIRRGTDAERGFVSRQDNGAARIVAIKFPGAEDFGGKDVARHYFWPLEHLVRVDQSRARGEAEQEASHDTCDVQPSPPCEVARVRLSVRKVHGSNRTRGLPAIGRTGHPLPCGPCQPKLTCRGGLWLCAVGPPFSNSGGARAALSSRRPLPHHCATAW